jgi:hypothetical protein
MTTEALGQPTDRKAAPAAKPDEKIDWNSFGLGMVAMFVIGAVLLIFIFFMSQSDKPSLDDWYVKMMSASSVTIADFEDAPRIVGLYTGSDLQTCEKVNHFWQGGIRSKGDWSPLDQAKIDNLADQFRYFCGERQGKKELIW